MDEWSLHPRWCIGIPATSRSTISVWVKGLLILFPITMCANVNMQPAAIETSKGKTHHWTRELELTNKVSSYFHQCFKSTADCLFAQAYASKHLVVKHSLKLTHMYVPINPPCSTPQHTHAHTHLPQQHVAQLYVQTGSPHFPAHTTHTHTHAWFSSCRSSGLSCMSRPPSTCMRVNRAMLRFAMPVGGLWELPVCVCMCASV